MPASPDEANSQAIRMPHERLDPSALNQPPRGRDAASRQPSSAAAQKRIEQIKAAAAELFFERGYHAADLRDIAQAAGIHASTLYYYFGEKEQLLYVILRDSLDNLIEEFDSRVLPIDDPYLALAEALTHQVERSAFRRHFAWSNYAEANRLQASYREDIQERRRTYTDRWIALIERGVARGAFPPIDTKIAAFGVMAMAQNVGRWYVPDGRMTPEEIARIFIRIAINGLGHDDLTPGRTTG
jgi:AcrR family transcriptional regulator